MLGKSLLLLLALATSPALAQRTTHVPPIPVPLGRPVENPCPQGFSVPDHIRNWSRKSVGPTYVTEASQILDCYLALHDPEIDPVVQSWLEGPLLGRVVDYEQDRRLRACEGVPAADDFSDLDRAKAWRDLSAKVLRTAVKKGLNFHYPKAALELARPDDSDFLFESLKIAKNKPLRDSLLSLLATRKENDGRLADPLNKLLTDDSLASPRLALDALRTVDADAAARKATQVLELPRSTPLQKDDAAKHLADRHPAAAKKIKAALLQNPVLSPGADFYFLTRVEPQPADTFDSLLETLEQSPQSVSAFSSDFYDGIDALAERYRDFSQVQLEKIMKALAKHKNGLLRFIDGTDFSPDLVQRPDIRAALNARGTDLTRTACELRRNPKSPTALARHTFEAREAKKEERAIFVVSQLESPHWDEGTTLALLPFLEDTDFMIRSHVIQGFNTALKRNPRSTHPHLARLLKAADPEDRASVIDVMGDAADRDIPLIVPSLIAALDDKKMKVRLTASAYLRDLAQSVKDPKPLIPLLREATKNGSLHVKMATVLPLAIASETSLDGAIDFIISNMNDPDSDVRQEAVIQLGTFGKLAPEKVVAALNVKAKGDPSIWVGHLAVTALVDIAQDKDNPVPPGDAFLRILRGNSYLPYDLKDAVRGPGRRLFSTRLHRHDGLEWPPRDR